MNFGLLCCGNCNPPPAPIYTNAPTVPDGFGNTLAGDALQPWELCGLGSSGGCGNVDFGTDCGATGLIPCGKLTGPGQPVTNHFTISDPVALLNFTGPCRKTGFKNVQAFATWPGQYGWIQSGCCDYPSPQVRYCSLKVESHCTFDSSRTYDWNPDFADESREMGGMTHSFFNKVNEASVDDCGNNTNTGSAGSSFSSQHYTYVHDEHAVHTYYSYDVTSNCTTEAFHASSESTALYLGTPEVTVDCGIVGVKWAPGDQISGTLEEVNAALATRAAGMLVGLAPEGDMPPGGTGYWNHTEYLIAPYASMVVTLSDTEVKFTAIAGLQIKTKSYLNDYWFNDTIDTFSYTYSKSRTLSSPYTFSQVLADAASLLSLWDLADDAQYPWRVDGEVWLAPLVKKDCGSSGPGITDGTVTPPFTDPGPDENGDEIYHHIGALSWDNTPSFTGAIQGAPQTVGYARFWDDHAQVLGVCCPDGMTINSDNGGNWWCLNGWGEYSPSSLPPTATHWTNKQQGGMASVGAWLLQAFEGVLAQKWAESLEAWPSVNYARPFGRDRFLVDYSPCTNTGDYVGDICLDGTKPLRFPTARPIGGTIAISSASQSGVDIILTTAENHWLKVGDVIDFNGVAGLGSGVAVTAATPNTTTFTVVGTLAGTYSGGGTISSHWTASDTWKWDWTCPRHTFVVQQWHTDLAGSGSIVYVQEQGSLMPAAKTSVLYSSPNTESFSNGFSAGWGSILNETCYAPSEWHLTFLQAVADPFFSMPTQCGGDPADAVFGVQPAPCADCPETTANGHTAIVCVQYPPLVEPMLQPPEGAPVLPVPFGSFDGGMPTHCVNNCSAPNSRAVIQAMRAGWLDCNDWKVVVHDHCVDATDPASNSQRHGAGDSGIGAGDGDSILL